MEWCPSRRYESAKPVCPTTMYRSEEVQVNHLIRRLRVVKTRASWKDFCQCDVRCTSPLVCYPRCLLGSQNSIVMTTHHQDHRPFLERTEVPRCYNNMVLNDIE